MFESFGELSDETYFAVPLRICLRGLASPHFPYSTCRLRMFASIAGVSDKMYRAVPLRIDFRALASPYTQGSRGSAKTLPDPVYALLCGVNAATVSIIALARRYSL